MERRPVSSARATSGKQVGAPYETAHARMLLGLAFRRQGNEDAATSELEAALATFARLGAKLDEESVNERLGRLQTRRTFVFTDIVDSTKLLETLGNEKWKRLLARHDELLRERIVDKGGEVVKRTGDGFFAAFDNPKAAVEAAVAIQRALDAEVVAPDVRIGLHTGGAFHTGSDASDYGGDGVHVAARIGAARARGRDPGQPRDARRRRHGVPPFRAAHVRRSRASTSRSSSSRSTGTDRREKLGTMTAVADAIEIDEAAFRGRRRPPRQPGLRRPAQDLERVVRQAPGA